MSLLKSLHVDAHNWMTKYPTNTWSKHTFSPRIKCDILQNDIAETFNSFILDARDKLIITMFEMIRRLLMQRFVAKKEGMENYRGPKCPRIQTKLERAKLESRNYICYVTGDGRFEVESPWEREVVDLNSQTCTCKFWDLTGIPCGHGVAAAYKMRRTPEEYVDPYYSTSTFLNAYSTTIGPVLGEEYWPPTNCNQILPPEYKTAPGRPKKARKRAEDEPQNPFTNTNTRKGVTTKCGNCGNPGNNCRSCKGPANPNRKIYKKKKKSKHWRTIYRTDDYHLPTKLERVLERMLMPRGFIKFVLIPFTIKSLVRLLFFATTLLYYFVCTDFTATVLQVMCFGKLIGFINEIGRTQLEV
ncbi:Glycoside hydrolase, family 47 [Senna tora]|uniref:Glycoside hydrolase, family 47 n=1 Tax=Senna tora TaxID=362788 RepID=A0A834X5F4_9FABA|nr:Glycoside hydrolase, family 47 [Senna tora]